MLADTAHRACPQIAYNVVDLESMPEDATGLQDALLQVEGVVSSRILSGQPGMYYSHK